MLATDDGIFYSQQVSRSTAETEPVTVESMLTTIEALRKEFPGLGECQHDQLIQSKWLPENRFLCIRCHELLVMPEYLLLDVRVREL